MAIVAARTRYLRDHPNTKFEDLVIYTTSQTHSLGAKAGVVLGLQVRVIDVAHDDQFALRGKSLRDALEEDARIGRKPFILGNASSHKYLFSSLNVLLTSCNCRNHLIRCTRQHPRNNGSWYGRLHIFMCPYSLLTNRILVSKRSSVALGTCRCGMGGHCIVLS